MSRIKRKLFVLCVAIILGGVAIILEQLLYFRVFQKQAADLGSVEFQSTMTDSSVGGIVMHLLRSCSDYATMNQSDGNVGAKTIIPHAKDLQDHVNLCRSFRHQYKFFSVRSSVLSWVKTHEEQRHLLHGKDTNNKWFAIILNEDYAYRHIFKSGGTSVVKQTAAHSHVSQSDIGNRRLLATVRDPLEHFLSGWAECGSRNFKVMMNLTASDAYDDRVQAWLQYLTTDASEQIRKGGQAMKHCRIHSFPQANFLLQSDGEFNTNIDIVGDLGEIPALLEAVGFHYNASISKGRDASKDEIKSRHFPPNKSLLSARTITDICRYVALDYYLFDFDPPATCREELMANIADMNITVPYYNTMK